MTATLTAPVATAAPRPEPCRRWPREAAALLVVVGVTALVLARLAADGAGFYLTTDGDSLTLPLMAHWASAPGAFQPVMSTQLLAFPEGVLYLAAAAVTTSVRAALVLDAFVYALLLHLSLRWLASHLVPGRRAAAAAAAGTCTYLLLAALDGGRVAVGLLTTTHYNGVLLGGVAGCACTLSVLRARRDDRSRRLGRLLAAQVVVVAALAWSNPLYDFWVAAPTAACAAAAALRRLWTREEALLVAVTQACGVVLGAVAQAPFKHVLMSGAAQYVRLSEAAAAASGVVAGIRSNLSRPSGVLEAATVAVLVVLGGRLALRRSGGGDATFAASFAIATPLLIDTAVIVAGNAPPRYFTALTVFPVAVVPMLWASLPARAPGRPAIVVALLGAIAVGGIGIPGVNRLLDPAALTDESCMQAALDHHQANGLGDYWAARALDLYSTDGDEVLDASPVTLFPWPWLNDLGTYRDRHFTFVLVNRFPNGPTTIHAADVRRLGPPMSVTTCPHVVVYRYAPGSAAARTLDDGVDTQIELLDREHGYGS